MYENAFRAQGLFTRALEIGPPLKIVDHAGLRGKRLSWAPLAEKFRAENARKLTSPQYTPLGILRHPAGNRKRGRKVH